MSARFSLRDTGSGYGARRTSGQERTKGVPWSPQARPARTTPAAPPAAPPAPSRATGTTSLLFPGLPLLLGQEAQFCLAPRGKSGGYGSREIEAIVQGCIPLFIQARRWDRQSDTRAAAGAAHPPSRAPAAASPRTE